MTNITRLGSGVRYSRVVISNGMVFLTGQTADDVSQDIQGQTRETLGKIEALLAEAGSDKSHILSAQIWLKDITRDFAGMNEIWDAWTVPNAAPTRATAQCEMAEPELLVEIIITAVVAL